MITSIQSVFGIDEVQSAPFNGAMNISATTIEIDGVDSIINLEYCEIIDGGSTTASSAMERVAVDEFA